MLISQVAISGAVPPKIAAQIAYGNPIPDVRTRVGNNSHNVADSTPSIIASSTQPTISTSRNVMKSPFRSRLNIGQARTKKPTAYAISTGRLPTRSDSAPAAGVATQNTANEITPPMNP